MQQDTYEFIDTFPVRLASLSVYTSFKKDKFAQSISQIVILSNDNTVCNGINDSNVLNIVNNYTAAFNYLNQSEYMGNLADYIFDYTLYDDNYVLEQSSKNNYIPLSVSVKDAFSKDIDFLNTLAYLSSDSLKEYIKIKANSFLINDSEFLNKIIDNLPQWENSHKKFKVINKSWSSSAVSFAEHAKKHGVGIFSKYSVFKIDDTGDIIPVESFSFKPLETLSGYEKEREKLIINVKAFCQGKKANNVLLYGDRGTGKSTSVKSVFSHFKNENLKLVEITKANLCHFGKIINILSKQNNKFIIFIDDLAFNDGDESFFQLKVFLEGGVVEPAENIIVCATTNRIHLIKESLLARQGDEIHKADSIDETLSLSERFGIIITYLAPDKVKFITLVSQMASDRNIPLSQEEIVREAEKWALLKGSRSLRCAKQCLDFLESKFSVE